MAYTIKRNKKVFISQETTPYEYEAPQSSHAVNAKYDALELQPTIEKIENFNISNGLHNGKEINGLQGANGSLSTSMKSSGVEGAKPEWHPLMEALLGKDADIAGSKAIDSSDVASTVSILQFNDVHDFKVGQTAIVKIAGNYCSRPIVAVDSSSITLGYPLPEIPENGVMVSAVCTWNTKSEPTPFSITLDIENGGARERAHGCVVSALSLSNVSVGQQPFMDWTFEGFQYQRDLTAVNVAPTYDSSVAPIVASACLVDGEGNKVEYSEFTLSIETTWQLITDACKANGKKSYKVIGRTISGTINPNKMTTDVKEWEKFVENQTYSLYISFKVPTGMGEYKDVVSYYLPKVQTRNLQEAEDGVLKDNVEFNAFVDSSADSLIYISVN